MRLETAKGIYKDKATRSDIIEAFQDDEGRGKFIILSWSNQDYIQAVGEGDGPYSMECGEGDEGGHLQCSEELSKAEVESIFLKYFEGDESWRRAFGWSQPGTGGSQDRCSMVPLVCSILGLVPVAITLMVFIPLILKPAAPGGCMPGLGEAVVLLFVGGPALLVTVVLLIISIASGMKSLERRGAKGKSLVKFAIALGISELLIVIVFLGFFLSQ